MYITRRSFLLVSMGLLAGCKSPEATGASDGPRVIDAGPATRFSADGVYDSFREHGFFLVRKGDQLRALSSYCTHRKCKLVAEPDRSFYCKCHGSTFDPQGRVTKGPARRDLPSFTIATAAGGHLFVTIPAI
jgi:Rieske Fe-S protein